ncbi:17163_t:CDS:2, partial [Acaulospora morrowiae]
MNFATLLKKPEGYDVKIVAGEEPNVKEFKAHKAILISKSDYFKSAFSLQWERVEDGITIFKKPNITPSIFEILLNDELQLLEVYQQLEKRLLKDESAWKPRDIITALEHDHLTTLYNFSMVLVCRNPKIIFESEDFLNMKEGALIDILKSNDLELDEFEIWQYVIQWGIENTNSIICYDLKKWTPENFMDLKNTLNNCIPHIRFFRMSPNDYKKLRAHFKDILPGGLDNEISQYFSDPDFKPSINILPLRNHPLKSNIIDAKDEGLIASWIDRQGASYHFKNLPFKFNLIYRASRDGFKIYKFHNNCDDKNSTLVVIKVRDSGEIIGGFNPLRWDFVLKDKSFSDYINFKYKASDFFIFSLSNREVPILSRISSIRNITSCTYREGPSFGLDLRITLSKGSYNGIIGESEKCSYEKKITDRQTFEIEEYEVFQIIDKRPFKKI